MSAKHLLVHHPNSDPLAGVNANVTPSVSSLVLLCAECVGRHVSVQNLLPYLPYISEEIVASMLGPMDHYRLRSFDLMLESLLKTEKDLSHIHEPGFAFLPSLTQREWRRRVLEHRIVATSSYLHNNGMDWSAKFWENELRVQIRSEENIPRVEQQLEYFCGNSTHRIRRNELKPRAMDILLQLPALVRIEMHNIFHSAMSWEALRKIIYGCLTLKELSFFHSKVEEKYIRELHLAILHRVSKNPKACIPKLEFVSSRTSECALTAFQNLLTDESLNWERVCLKDSFAHLNTGGFIPSLLASETLRYMDFSVNYLSDEDIQFDMNSSIFGDSKTVHSLNLSHNCFTWKVAQKIAQAQLLNYHIQHLDLSQNEINDGGMKYMATIITSPTCSLETLILKECNISIVGMKTLLQSLYTNQTVTKLDIGGNYCGKELSEFISELLASNSTVEELGINYVGLGHDGCGEQLSQAIISNDTLVKLSIGENRVRDIGIQFISKAIRERKKPFEILDLNGNMITVVGLKILTEALLSGSEIPRFEPSSIKRRKLVENSSDRPIPVRVLDLQRNPFEENCVEYLSILRSHLEVVLTTEWSHLKSVYDDEI